MYDESLVLEYFEKIRNEIITYDERELNVSKIKEKAIVIIGPRRAGKTYYLLNKFFRNMNRSIYVDFESIEFSKILPEEFLKIIALYEARYGKIDTVFLDEIQVLEDWQSLVRSLLNRKYYIFISGSSSRLLSKEVATQLRGRSLSYILLPFSFREFLLVKKFSKTKFLTETEVQEVKLMLREYIEFGGFPEVVINKNKDKILKEYFDTIFYKDFVERHRLKSIITARTIFEYILQNFSNEISIEKIKRFIKKTVNIETKTTIYSYIDKLSDTFGVFFIEKFSNSVYKRKSWPKKVYICDVGISKAISYSEDIGKKMENIVFLELLREINEKPLLEIYYWKDYQQHEVDFVIKEGTKVKQLVQVTYANNRDEMKEREIKSLLKASEELKCKDLLVITWNFEDEEKIKGKKIKFVPLWKWLIANYL